MANGTPIGRVRGLGASGEGPHHWLVQRFTAIGNLFLMLWFGVSLALMPAYDFASMRDWLSGPLNSALVALLVISVFWHARLGLQVLVEDYIHDAGTKFGIIALLNLVAFASVAFALFSIARIAFGAA